MKLWQYQVPFEFWPLLIQFHRKLESIINLMKFFLSHLTITFLMDLLTPHKKEVPSLHYKSYTISQVKRYFLILLLENICINTPMILSKTTFYAINGL